MSTVDWVRGGVVALTGQPGGPPLVPPAEAATRICSADPLTGPGAADLALAAPRGGRGRVLDAAMSRVVATTLAAAQDFRGRPARRTRGSRVADTSPGPVPGAPPRRRSVAGDTPEPGVHTTAVPRELRIPRP